MIKNASGLLNSLCLIPGDGGMKGRLLSQTSSPSPRGPPHLMACHYCGGRQLGPLIHSCTGQNVKEVAACPCTDGELGSVCVCVRVCVHACVCVCVCVFEFMEDPYKRLCM